MSNRQIAAVVALCAALGMQAAHARIISNGSLPNGVSSSGAPVGNSTPDGKARDARPLPPPPRDAAKIRLPNGMALDLR